MINLVGNLDREDTDMYQISVIAADGGSVPLTAITTVNVEGKYMRTLNKEPFWCIICPWSIMY